MIDTPAVHGILTGLRRPDILAPADLSLVTHAKAALGWVRRAYTASGDGGISKGYDLLRNRWAPSYPETTGYTIPTLLNAAACFNRPDLSELALSIADYLLARYERDRGIVHWEGGPDARPVVFDTGQVLFGWLAAYESSGEARYLDTAAQVGSWLAEVQDGSGAWLRFQHLDTPKVIDTRVAWALLVLHRHTGDPRHLQAARRNLEWALSQQTGDGWFRHCAFTPQEDPFTHTLAYTAEGLWESGLLLDEPRFIRAARKTADALLARQRADGSLHSTYAAGWRATSRSSCLTGNCQTARLWLCLYRQTGHPPYYRAAEKAIAFVAGTQRLHTSDPNVRGAIAGSYPIFGRYERFKYPNWAAKFFIDALLALDAARTGDPPPRYAG